MQYRASFIIMTIGHFLITASEIFAIMILFDRFGSLGGWSLHEVALFYGLVNMSFAITESVGRGFDTFPQIVKNGDFDRLLLRPRSTVFQVASREVELLRIGRFTQGLIVFIWAALNLDVTWTIAKTGLAIAAVSSGVCLFYGLFIIQATMSFWTIESLELMNMLTYGGTEAGQFPMSIYKSWFRMLFIFVVPLACSTYFPGLAIIGKSDPVSSAPVWFFWIAPLIGVVFLIICLQIWCFGVRHYTSTGS